MIEFKNVVKKFDEHIVLNNISLKIYEGEILYIIGLSGVGKSVLMKHLVGLLKPDEGEIYIDGVEITSLSEKELFDIRMKCAFVFQHSTLLDSMNLCENVALPLRKHRNLSQVRAEEIAMEYLQLTFMDDKATLFPSEIAPGERKRIAIARALTFEPKYIIFDEPTTGLDVIAASHIDKLILDLHNKKDVTSIVISHDLRSIFSVAQRIIFLYKGNIYLDGGRKDFLSSKDMVVRQFIEGRPDGPIKD